MTVIAAREAVVSGSMQMPDTNPVRRNVRCSWNFSEKRLIESGFLYRQYSPRIKKPETGISDNTL